MNYERDKSLEVAKYTRELQRCEVRGDSRADRNDVVEKLIDAANECFGVPSHDEAWGITESVLGCGKDK